MTTTSPRPNSPLLDAPTPEPLTPFHLLPKLSDLDDVEEYLWSFKVLAANEPWDRKHWVWLLAPFLTGEAQRFYHSLKP